MTGGGDGGAGLVVEGLSKRYGDATAVDGVDLVVPGGAFACLLGPSGCGKTTLLRMIAGLETPSGGRVLLGGEDLAGVPVHRRDLGMVFQSLALFPHLDVGDNIAYALAIRGRPKPERAARVAELLELVRLPGVERRAVSRLSGGQRQRVAIARALALSPRLFLLDEPLSALDAGLREAMQVELRELQQRLGITTIVVTHDQREAMTMADLVVVMGAGRVHQTAPPVELYRRPADAFVAGFIGQTNLLPATRDGDGARALGAPLPAHAPTLPGAPGRWLLSLRPEDIDLVAPGAGLVDARVRFVRELGASVETFLEADGRELVVTAPPRGARRVRVGDAVGVAPHLDRAVALPAPPDSPPDSPPDAP